MQTQCPHCHEWSECDDHICPFCGAPLTPSHVTTLSKAPADIANQNSRHSLIHSKRFWLVCIALGCLITAALILWKRPLSEAEIYYADQFKIIEESEKVEWWQDQFETNLDFTLDSVNQGCLWYYENLPQSISRYRSIAEDKITKTLLNRHRSGKCTKGKKDNLLKAWHLGENNQHEKICYVDSLHPPKGTRPDDPGQFRLSVILEGPNYGNVQIEPLHIFRPGHEWKTKNKLVTYYYAVDDDDINMSVSDIKLIQKPFDYNFEFYSYQLKRGKYLHIVFPVIPALPEDKPDIFYFVYRTFPIWDIDACGTWAKHIK